MGEIQRRCVVTDDIVTRLRDIASLQGNLSGNIIPTTCNEAADEIERLREELVQTKNQLKLLIAIETAGKDL